MTPSKTYLGSSILVALVLACVCAAQSTVLTNPTIKALESGNYGVAGNPTTSNSPPVPTPTPTPDPVAAVQKQLDAANAQIAELTLKLQGTTAQRDQLGTQLLQLQLQLGLSQATIEGLRKKYEPTPTPAK